MKKITLVLFVLLFTSKIYAQEQNVPQPVDAQITVSKAIWFKETQSLNMLFSEKQVEDIQQEIEREKAERSRRKAQVFKYTAADGAQYGNDPATMQTTMGTRQPLAPKTKWNGLSGSSQPLDPTGSVGMTQYVQSINATPFAAYDKTGTGTAVYSGNVGTITGTSSTGDPVVVYDKFADRWCITNMTGSTGIGFAVSKTNDPAGTWSAYKFTVSGSNDYLKFGVWSDGYYMTFNSGGNMLIFERDAMIAGSAGARSIAAKLTVPLSGFWLPMPGDADGLIPPAGLRCPLFGYTDNGWGGSAVDGVKIWSVGVTWGTTPSANITVDATVPTAAFDASFESSWDNVTQPGSQKLDVIGGILMYRAQWNSFIGTNRVALNWPVKISTGVYAIKWVELRQDQTTKAWSLYQEGTYNPDGASRWIGSIAMDCNGNIGLCYSKASSSIPLCLAYTGRLASDPLGTMSLAETVVFPGTGSVSGSNRIGDYAQTSLDPADPTTFWHTGTFCNNGRKTGIFSFQIATTCLTDVPDNEKAKEPEFSAIQSGSNLIINASNLFSNNNHVIQLFEISGKLISEKSVVAHSNSFETTLNISGLASGTYIVRIGTPDFQKVKKVVIQ